MGPENQRAPLKRSQDSLNMGFILYGFFSFLFVQPSESFEVRCLRDLDLVTDEADEGVNSRRENNSGQGI